MTTLKGKSGTRLWALLGRDAPVAVILRRGPSKQVLLIKWRTDTDTFETGQWFKGRVYERRCDLSPDGELLIYFAANQKPPLRSWTAISKPPYFTAIALWPKGDCWNGGGWFIGNRKIRLNHPPNNAEDDKRVRPLPVRVAGYAEFYGEDATVWGFVLERDGWQMENAGKSKNRRGRHGWDINPPTRWRKPHPIRKNLVLEMAIIGIAHPQHPWYRMEYKVFIGADVFVDLGEIDWADWDQRGDLVFAKVGRLFRQPLGESLTAKAKHIADFRSLKFQNVPPP